MAAFTKKSINPSKRVCLCLKEARERKGISLEELSKTTRMNKTYLLALEECRWHDLPFSEIYQKHFITAYTEALGVEARAFVNQFMDEEAPAAAHRNLHAPRQRFSLQNIPMLLRAGAMMLVAIACFGYLVLQVKRILEPPQLVVYSPDQGYITTRSSLLVQGKTELEAQVTINGASIMQNESGEFATTLDLPTGVNTIVISAKKKHGKITTETRNVIVKSPSLSFRTK